MLGAYTQNRPACGGSRQALGRQGHFHSCATEACAIDTGRQLTLEKVHLRRTDEAGHKAVGRVVVHLQRRAYLLHPALVHHHDAITQRHGFDLIVGDVDHARADTFVQFTDLFAHAHAQLGIEVGQRLVEEEGIRPPH